MEAPSIPGIERLKELLVSLSKQLAHVRNEYDRRKLCIQWVVDLGAHVPRKFPGLSLLQRAELKLVLADKIDGICRTGAIPSGSLTPWLD
jgi:hypothetical protein